MSSHFSFISLKDKDVIDLEELASPHHIPAQQLRPDQGELFSNLEKELAALDDTPSQPEQPEVGVIGADNEKSNQQEPDESQQGSAVQTQKVIVQLEKRNISCDVYSMK